MSDRDAEKIKKRLQAILPTVDLETVTARSIIERLEKEFGTSLKSFRKLIKEEIDAYLASQDDDGDDDDDDDPAPAGTKRKQAPGDDLVELSDKRFAGVRCFKGMSYLDIREYFGEGKPTKKGVTLKREHVSKLLASARQVAKAIKNEDTDYCLELTSTKLLKVNEFRDRLVVDIRDHYEKDGELLPSGKGLSLKVPEWEILLESLPEFEKQLNNSDGGQPKKAKAESNSSNGSGPATAFLDLGNDKRAEVTEFSRKKYFSLREYYEKDGQMRPGAKGIALPKDQFQKLVDHADEISLAAATRQEGFEMLLAPKRKVQVSSFKHNLYVSIREYYDKDGQELPTRKGVSLRPEQWQKLAKNLHTFEF